MHQAHASFGIMGFSFIADSYKSWLNKSLVIEVKKEFISFMGSSKGIGLFVAYVAFYLLILKVGNADFLWGIMLGIVAGSVIAVISVLLTYRPLSRDFVIYKTFTSCAVVLCVSFFTMSLQVLVLDLYENLFTSTWGALLIVLIGWFFSVFINLFDKILKGIVKKADELELMTNYS